MTIDFTKKKAEKINSIYEPDPESVARRTTREYGGKVEGDNIFLQRYDEEQQRLANKAMAESPWADVEKRKRILAELD